MSGIHRAPSIYFDACIYLAVLRNEVSTYGEGRIRAIERIWKRSEAGGIVVVTSAITITEVLDHKLPSKKDEKRFHQAVRQNVHQVEDVTGPIAVRASQYRDYYEKNPVKQPASKPAVTRKFLTTPDAIHLATATILGVNQFWTFDGVAGSKKDKSIGLLWLGNKAATDELIITQPENDPPPAPELIETDLFQHPK